MTQTRTNTSIKSTVHLDWLDNLRTFIVFLVVLIHAGGVYEASGTWAGFWIVDDPSVNNFSGLIFIIMDIFMMPVLFFISGYLAPASLSNKSTWRFIKAKFTRLMVPWMVAVLTLIPLYKVIFLASRGLPQQSWTTYFHFSNGIWGMNWLWFLPALFLTNLIYVGLSRIRIRLPELSLGKWVLIVFLIGFIFSLSMDMGGLRGWTNLPFLDIQNERSLIYILAFLLGAIFYRKGALDSKPKIGWLYYSVNGTNWIPVMLYIVFLLYPWLNPGKYIISETVHRSVLWLSYHISLVSLGYVLIQTFRRYFTKCGTLGRILNRNSCSIYVLHVVVQGGIAWWMLNLDSPSFPKHLILAVSSYAVSCVLVSCMRIVTCQFVKCYPHERNNRSSSVPNNIVEHGAGSQAG